MIFKIATPISNFLTLIDKTVIRPCHHFWVPRAEKVTPCGETSLCFLCNDVFAKTTWLPLHYNKKRSVCQQDKRYSSASLSLSTQGQVDFILFWDIFKHSCKYLFRTTRGKPTRNMSRTLRTRVSEDFKLFLEVHKAPLPTPLAERLPSKVSITLNSLAPWMENLRKKSIFTHFCLYL